MDMDELTSSQPATKITVVVRLTSPLTFRRGDSFLWARQEQMYIPPGFVGIAHPPEQGNGRLLSCAANGFFHSDSPRRSLRVYNRRARPVVLATYDAVCIINMYRYKDSTMIVVKQPLVLPPGAEVELIDLDALRGDDQFVLCQPSVARRELNTCRLVVPVETCSLEVENTRPACVACNQVVEQFPFIHTHGGRYVLKNTGETDYVLPKNHAVATVYKVYEQLSHVRDGALCSEAEGGPMYVYAKTDYVVPPGAVVNVETTFRCKPTPGYYLKVENVGLYRSRVMRRRYTGGALVLVVTNDGSSSEKINTGVPVARCVAVKRDDMQMQPMRCLNKRSLHINPHKMRIVMTDVPAPPLNTLSWDICEQYQPYAEVSLYRIQKNGVMVAVVNHSEVRMTIAPDEVVADAYMVFKIPV